MTDGVVKATSITDTYDVLYDILSTNMTDPLSRSDAHEFIMSSYPNPNLFVDIRSVASGGWQFPIIVIEGANLTRVPLSVDRAQTRTKEEVITEIEVHARTSLERDQLAEQILDSIYSNCSSLSTGTLQNTEVMGTSNDIDFLGNHKVRIKRMTLKFHRVD